MEKTSEPGHRRGIVKAALADLLVLRPAFALAAVWLTTAGHTANFREMDAARGWVTAEGYSLHSIYLLALTLTLLAAPRLARWSGSYPLVLAGLTMLGAGSLVNGVWTHAPRELLVLGRVLAGIGAGLVIRSAPRILPAGQEGRVAWAGIVLPAAGPVVIALAVEWSPWWSWQGGFLFEVVLALLSLALVLSIADPPDLDRDSPRGPTERLDYLPAAVVAALSVWYVMHWGQLHGWLEGPDITGRDDRRVGSSQLASLDRLAGPRCGHAARGSASTGADRLWRIRPVFQFPRHGSLRRLAGELQSLDAFVADLVAHNRVYRSARTRPDHLAETVGRIRWRGARVACPGRRNEPLAPQHNELAILEPAQHRRVRLVRRPPALAARPATVLDGLRQRDGAVGNDDLHQPRTPPRGTDPAVAPGRTVHGRNVKRRGSRDGALGRSPAPVLLCRRPGFHPGGRARRSEFTACRPHGRGRRGAAARQAEALEFRAVNYEADNLVFATIYGGFQVTSLVLAAVCGVYSLLRYLSSPSSSLAEGGGVAPP